MRRLVPITCAVAIVTATTAGAAHADSLCVGRGAHCFGTIQAAVDAAHDGDIVRVRPGTYAGGVTIAKTLTLAGAGSRVTTISGGGPVVTIGVAGAASEPMVAIRGLTITGGVTSSSTHCGPTCGTDFERATALGGGIEIPPAAGDEAGATVTVADSVIAGNRVAPAVTVPSVRSICPTGPCRFALAGGGGIDNWGALTLINTRVVDNQAGGALNSEAEGGGILHAGPGPLTLENAVVAGNRATASAPNGRFAEAGGIFVGGGELTVRGGGVSDNVAALASALPSDVGQLAVGGGIHLTDAGAATITGATIDGNRLSMTNAVGDATAFSAGLHADGPLVMRDSSVSGNEVSAITTGDAPASAFADSGAGELNVDATISGTRLDRNSVRAESPAGTAVAAAGAGVTAAFESMTITDSTVVGNRLTASTATGSAVVQGAGLANGGVLTLTRTTIDGNAGRAIGPDGSAQGGGIWNAHSPDGPPTALALVDSQVTRNALLASPGLTAQGGGLFTTEPVSLTATVIARNVPDQCFGC
jgi:hypothetical protein